MSIPKETLVRPLNLIIVIELHFVSGITNASDRFFALQLKYIVIIFSFSVKLFTLLFYCCFGESELMMPGNLNLVSGQNLKHCYLANLWVYYSL